MIKQKTKKLYSFDIFDTLVTRKVAMPAGIFALMQEKLDKDLPENFREDFYIIRINSEKYARGICNKENGTREIIFDDIYSCMQEQYKLSSDEIEKIKQLEIETELENLLPIDKNINELKKLIQDGNEVVLISDMYHSESTIRMFLCHIDKVFNDIKIYVSSEYKKNKHSGQLFTQVQEIEGIAFKNWSHHGDNIQADIKKPKSLGIRTIHTPLPELMPYEKEVLELYPSNSLFQAIVGSARLCRMNVQKKNQDKYDFGASYAAPIIYNYVNWVIDEALEKGFKTLHFVARDGYIPKIVADIIIQKRNLDIKTKYIYGSRMAWRVPCEENYEEIIKLLMDESVTKQSGKFLAYRLCVESDKFCKMLNIQKPNAILDVHDRFIVKEKLLNNLQIKEYILKSNNKKSQNLNEYIKQEFNFNEEDFVLIDVNGSGRTIDFLSKCINTISKKRIHAFYITTNLFNLPHNISQKYTYLLEQKPEYHYFELLFRAPHGQTIYYEKSIDKIIPVFEKFPVEKLENWGFNEYIEGIKNFIDKIVDYGIYSENNQLCYTYFDYITTKCDSKNATILGEIPYLTIGVETKVKKAAPYIPLFKIFFNFLLNRDLRQLSEFPFITIARGRKFSEQMINFLYSYNGLQDFLIELNLYFKLKSLSSEKIMLWGASIFLKNFLKKYKINNPNIIGIIDRNPNIQGQNFCGYTIYSPEVLFTIRPQKVIMTIKNKNESIYFDLIKEFKEKFPGTELCPNIFQLRSYSHNSNDKLELEKQTLITNSLNTMNRLMQLNLSTFNLHQKTFPQYKNIHQGKDIVILATGPSATDYIPMSNAIHIGVNRAFQMNKVVLDYVFLQDYSGKTPEYIDDLDKYEPSKCTKFYGLTTEYDININKVIPESNAIKANAHRYRTDWADLPNFNPQFVYDISSQPLGCFGSVVFPALQFALWTNPKRIYLVGCDCSLEGYAYNKEEKNFLIPYSLINAYKNFKDFARRYYPETEIISINPVGLKGIFKEIFTRRDYKEFWINDGLNNIIPLNHGENPEGWDPKEILKSIVQKYDIEEVLDFGCGYGRLTQAFNKEKYIGIDLNPQALEIAQEKNPGYKYQEVNIENQNYPKADMTLAYTVFLHLDDITINNIITNLALSTNRYIIIAEILGQDWRSKKLLPVFNRDREDYIDIMEKHGFSLIEEIKKPYMRYVNDTYYDNKKNRNLSFLIFSKNTRSNIKND